MRAFLEAPTLLRVGILLGVLALCAVWWGQESYFDMTVVNHFSHANGRWRAGSTFEVTIPHLVDEGIRRDERHRQGTLPPPTNF